MDMLMKMQYTTTSKTFMKYIRSFFILSIFSFCLTNALANTINVPLDGAQTLKFGQGLSEVFIANPDVADVQLSNSQTIYIFGKSLGTTKIFATDSKGNEVLSANVVVGFDLENFRELISNYDPHELVEVKTIPGGLLLEGPVDSPAAADNIVTLAQNFINKGKDSKLAVLNRLTIKPPLQVNLRVKIAEVGRGVLNQLGVNWQDVVSNVGNFKFGFLGNRAPFTATPILNNDVTSITQPPAVLTGGDQVSSMGFGFRNSKVNLNAALDLLSQDNLVTILAEPNLTAVSGETASFLAGGEFPYPVPQQFNTITIEFKQYGVSLAFTPTVMDGNLISMRVRPEVSELDPSTGIVLNQIAVPGILTRRAETTIQLGSGQSFAIAGLLKNTVKANISSLPGLGDIPILGPLFRSNDFQRGESELVILVTPYIVEPTSGKEMLLPTDGMNYASFVEQIFERRLIKPGVEKGKSPTFGPGGVRLIGPAGFSVD